MVNDLLCRHDVDVAIMDEAVLQDGDDDHHDDEVVVDFRDDLAEVLVEAELVIKNELSDNEEKIKKLFQEKRLNELI